MLGTVQVLTLVNEAGAKVQVHLSALIPLLGCVIMFPCAKVCGCGGGGGELTLHCLPAVMNPPSEVRTQPACCTALSFVVGWGLGRRWSWDPPGRKDEAGEDGGR